SYRSRQSCRKYQKLQWNGFCATVHNRMCCLVLRLGEYMSDNAVQYRRYDLFAQRCPTCTLLGEAQHTRYKCLLVIDPIKPSFSAWQPYMCLNSKTPR